MDEKEWENVFVYVCVYACGERERESRLDMLKFADVIKFSSSLKIETVKQKIWKKDEIVERYQIYTR